MQDRTQIVLAIFFLKSKELGLEVFLQNRLNGANDVLWEFPGGKVEKNEDLVSALQREIKEEVGCEISSQRINFLFSYPYQYLEKKLMLNFFTIELEQKMKVNDLKTTAWKNINEIIQDNFPLIEGSKQIIFEFIKHIRS